MSQVPRFTLTLDGQTPFRVLSFQGSEALDTPYAFDVKLVSTFSRTDLEEHLHKPAFLAFDDQGNGIHGYVYAFGIGEIGKRFTHYHLTLVPRLAYLAHATHQRIFQNLTTIEVIGKVLEGQGILSDAYQFFEPRIPLLPREYCVQYKETDLAFIQRLCADEGFSYSFRHSPDGHVLVFGDDEDTRPRLATAVFRHDAGFVPEHPVVSEFAVSVQTRTSKTRRRDYNHDNPRHTLDTRASSEQYPELEDYQFAGPGAFDEEGRGTLLANIALQRHRRDFQSVTGASNQPTLCAGALLPLTEHESAAWNAHWLLVEVTHTGKQPQVLEEEAPITAADKAGEFTQGYRNTFIATPKETAWRPALHDTRPLNVSTETAMVVGPPGEEIHCDKYGRIKIYYPWDLTDSKNASSSCWVRVSSHWAGAYYGAVAVPRVGMEVIVAYLNGNLDQPIVMGTVPNHANPVPYALPLNKTRSVLRTHSTPNGTGYNELHLEDRTGQELIYVRAERDMEQLVQHDSRIQVGNDKRETVVANSYERVQGDRHQTIEGWDRIRVLEESVSVLQASHKQVGTVLSVEAGMQIHLNAGASIVLSAGAQQISITPTGIFSTSPILPGAVPGIPAAATAALVPAPLVPGTMGREFAVTTQRFIGPDGKPTAKQIEAGPMPEVVHTLSVRLRPVEATASLHNVPFTVFADGAQVEEGLIEPDGTAHFKHVPGTQRYVIELPNGHRTTLAATDATAAPVRTKTEQHAHQGLRDTPTTPRKPA